MRIINHRLVNASMRAPPPHPPDHPSPDVGSQIVLNEPGLFFLHAA